MFFTATTQLAFASAASAALAKKVLPRATDAVRRFWSNYPSRSTLDGSDAPLVHAPSAYTVEAVNATNTPPKKTFGTPDNSNVRHSNSTRAQLAPGVSFTTLSLKKLDTTNVDPVPQVPACQWAAIGANFRIAQQASTNSQMIVNPKSQWPAVTKPKLPNASVKKSGWSIPPVPAPSQASSRASTSITAANDLPKPHRSADYTVPFPKVTSHSLRPSQSAPARMSRMTKPSRARRIIPAKRLVKSQDNESEPTNLKRQRMFHPYDSPIQAKCTPPRGSLAALCIPSPPPSDTPITSSDSVMSLSELTYGRQNKRTRTTLPKTLSSETTHERSTDSITQDVEMGVLDTLKTPEVTMSSQDLEEDFNEWIWSAPPTRVLDEEMRSPFDDDVDMKEVFGDEDEEMEEIYLNEEVVMKDWTDEDVEMAGVT